MFANFDTLTLLRPWWLLALLPMLWMLVRLWRTGNSNGDWQRYVDEALREHVLEKQAGRQSRWPLIAVALGWLLVIVVLVGPVWEQRPLPALQALQSQVVALDVSRSMDTDDRKPSRLSRAKFKLQDLLVASVGAETALLVFSHVAYVVSPLTDDRATLEAFLPAIDTSVVPVQGSRLKPAIDKAIELLQQAGRSGGSIVLITDAESDSAAEEAAEEALAAGYRVSVLAVATKSGAPIRQQDGSLLESADGSIALTRLDESGLRKLSSAGGGIYTELSVDNSDVESLLGSLNQEGIAGVQQTEQEITQWIERAPWLLLLVIPLSLLVFRRGVFA